MNQIDPEGRIAIVTGSAQGIGHAIAQRLLPTDEGFWSYLSMKPELFGNTQHNLLGHYSGPWAVCAKADELGLTIPDGHEAAVIERLREKLKAVRRQVNDEEFGEIIAAAS